jgi:hypothetical protein
MMCRKTWTQRHLEAARRRLNESIRPPRVRPGDGVRGMAVGQLRKWRLVLDYLGRRLAR